MGLDQTDPELQCSYLLFETKTGEGEFISAAQIEKYLKTEFKMMDDLLDLVVL